MQYLQKCMGSWKSSACMTQLLLKLSSTALFPKLWPAPLHSNIVWKQAMSHHLGLDYKYRFSGPTSELLKLNQPSDKIRKWFLCTVKREKPWFPPSTSSTRGATASQGNSSHIWVPFTLRKIFIALNHNFSLKFHPWLKPEGLCHTNPIPPLHGNPSNMWEKDHVPSFFASSKLI